MRLSAPVYRLKRQAKLLSREESIPLHDALDRVAQQEGYGSWSLLATRAAAAPPAGKLYPRLTPGDLVLLAARPGQGKTRMSLELAVEAMKSGTPAAFFSLEFNERDVHALFRDIGFDLTQWKGQFHFDGSDLISADHIVASLSDAPRGTLVIVDYLQLLDQRRENPDLMSQVRALKAFAKERGVIVVFISQIDRTFEAGEKPMPDIGDVRLPNPLDLKLFNRTCFLHNGEARFVSTA